MPLFDLSFTIDLFTLLVIIVLSMLIGFFLRSYQIRKKNRHIAELEDEMMQAHAEVLVVQKEYCDLESRVKDMPSPVIAMKNAAKEDDEKKKTQTPDQPPRQKNWPTRTA
jgi:hypothetical protein